MLLIVFGAFELFLGFRLLRVTFFLVGYMMGFTILTVLLGVLVISSTSTIGTVVSLYVITTFVSILLGYFCVTQPVFVTTKMIIIGLLLYRCGIRGGTRFVNAKSVPGVP